MTAMSQDPQHNYKKSNASRTLLIAAGGTGGHVFPALAIAQVLREQNWHIEWIGGQTGLEKQLVPAHDIPLHSIYFFGWRGKDLLTRCLMPFKLLRAFWQSLCIIQRVRPDLVLGMGGYISLPVGLAAALLRRPLIVHEQNAVAGLANRLLAPFAKRILGAFPNVLSKSEWLGNPVRSDLQHIKAPHQRYKEHQGPLHILVLGGSQGAQALNKIIPEALALLDISERPIVVHQAGQKHLEMLQKKYETLGVSAHTQAFIHDMAQAYAQADLVICRAGAMTIAEISTVGVAALLIPFPYAVDDHQTKNAQFLLAKNAAHYLPEHQLTAAYLADYLRQQTRENLRSIAEKAFALSKRNASQDIAEICIATARKKQKNKEQKVSTR